MSTTAAGSQSGGRTSVTTETSQSSPDRHVRVVLAESDPNTRESIVSHVSGLSGIELVAAESSAGDAIIAAYERT